MTMLWHADDRISLFRSTLNKEFKFTGETGDSAGDFEEIPSEIFVTGAEISTNYGVYPYNSTTTISKDETITLTMPSVQAYAQNSFGCGANTAVAATENSSSRFLPFRNVGGFLVVKIYSPSGVVKSVELKGNNGEVLAGEATVQAKYGYLPLLTMGDGTDSITIDCGGGVEVGTTEDSATHFWFVVPPTTFESGFTVSVTDTAGAVTTKSTTKRNEISRNEVTVMSAFEIAETENKPTPANNEIWYTNRSTTGPTQPRKSAFGDAIIVSNEYDSENGHWVITFDRELTTIGSNAFRDCDSLTSVTIPDSVTTIGKEAFYYCGSLTSVTIGNSVTTIGKKAFWSCGSLTSVTIGDSVTTIGEYAFHSCISLTSVTIPDSVTTIEGDAFSACTSLTSITIPDSVTTIEGRTFFKCTSLTSVTIPDSVTEIGEWAFGWCYRLTSVTIPDSVTTIGDDAFRDCNRLTSVTIGNSVTTIGDLAFFSCDSLTSVTIPDSVTTIGNNAFCYCTSLKYVYCKPTTPPAGGHSMFDEIASNSKIYVPTYSVEAYKKAYGWRDYASDIVGYDF